MFLISDTLIHIHPPPPIRRLPLSWPLPPHSSPHSGHNLSHTILFFLCTYADSIDRSFPATYSREDAPPRRRPRLPRPPRRPSHPARPRPRLPPPPLPSPLASAPKRGPSPAPIMLPALRAASSAHSRRFTTSVSSPRATTRRRVSAVGLSSTPPP